MFNWEDKPLPDDGVPVYYLNRDKEKTFNDYHDVVDSTGNPLRLVLNNYSDWQEVDGVMRTVNRSNMHKKGEVLPYDEVPIATINDGIPVVFARSNTSRQVYVHCALDGDWDIIMPLGSASDETIPG